MSDAADKRVATPNSVLASQQAVEDHSSTKHSVGGSENCEHDKPKRSFKGVANLVLAMKRFQASLNPTYTYGKQPARAKHVRTPSPTTISSGTASDEEQQHYAYEDRGHKASYLFKSLPQAPGEQASENR